MFDYLRAMCVPLINHWMATLQSSQNHLAHLDQ